MEHLLYILAISFGCQLFTNLIVSYLSGWSFKQFLISYWGWSSLCVITSLFLLVGIGKLDVVKTDTPKTEAVKTVEYKGKANEPDITGISVNADGGIDLVKTTEDRKLTDINIEDVIEDASRFWCLDCLTDEFRQMVLDAVFKCDECGKTFPMAVQPEGKKYIRKNFHRIYGTDRKEYICESCWREKYHNQQP